MREISDCVRFWLVSLRGGVRKSEHAATPLVLKSDAQRKECQNGLIDVFQNQP
jgi:hypothetical protein